MTLYCSARRVDLAIRQSRCQFFILKSSTVPERGIYEFRKFRTFHVGSGRDRPGDPRSDHFAFLNSLFNYLVGLQGFTQEAVLPIFCSISGRLLKYHILLRQASRPCFASTNSTVRVAILQDDATHPRYFLGWPLNFLHQSNSHKLSSLAMCLNFYP